MWLPHFSHLASQFGGFHLSCYKDMNRSTTFHQGCSRFRAGSIVEIGWPEVPGKLVELSHLGYLVQGGPAVMRLYKVVYTCLYINPSYPILSLLTMVVVCCNYHQAILTHINLY